MDREGKAQRRRTLVVVGLFGVGCVSHTHETSVSQLVAQGRANQLAAVAEYRGERVLMTGIVRQTGVRNVDRFRAHYTGTAFGTAEATGGHVNVLVPLVELVDAVDTSAIAYCYFPTDDMKEVAAVPLGSRVTVSCQFQQYTEQGPAAQVVLYACEIE